ncbi:MAG TPA: 30S ribosomal protein S2 [Candidatus Nanopelagicaceae bacterium]|nr:30S ribosomal protein S2 [Candidatus Nanopelagicaceae bacterium]
MPVTTLTELLQNGVHFGHQTSRWNPKMRPYIFASRGGIHILDVSQTVDLLAESCSFAHDTVAQGGQILFVGTKKQAHDTIEEECARSHQPYVVNRWMGGMLTNFEVVKLQLKRLAELSDQKERDGFAGMIKKEQRHHEDDLERLQRNFGGITNMKRLPAAMFVVDPHKERLAVTEANKLEIPIIAITDSNCNPDEISHVIPGNDDAIRSVRLIVSRLTDAIISGLDQRRQIEVAQTQAAAEKAAQLRVAQEAEAAAKAAAEAAAQEEATAAGTAAPGEPVDEQGATQ